MNSAHAPNTTLRTLAAVCLGTVFALGATCASAAGNNGMGLYVQGGHNFEHGTDTENLFVGLTIPMQEARPAWFGWSFAPYWDMYVGQWRGPQPNGVDKSYTNIAISAVARYRLDGGNSPWFWDAGLGLSYLDDIYEKPGRSFSTRLNFTPRLGIGRSFGDRDAHEVSLNYQHYSNAGIKKPNPGEDFIQLRYAYKF